MGAGYGLTRRPGIDRGHRGQGRRLWLKPFARRPSYVKPARTAGRARTTSRRSASAGAVKRAGRIPAEPLLRYPAPDDVRARLTTRLRLRSRSGALPRKKNPAEGGAQVLGRTNSEGRRVRSTSTNAQSRPRFRPFHKKFRRPLSRSRPHEIAPATRLVPAKAGIHSQAGSRGPRDASVAGVPARGRADTGDVAPIALFCYFVGSRDELKPSFSFGPVNH